MLMGCGGVGRGGCGRGRTLTLVPPQLFEAKGPCSNVGADTLEGSGGTGGQGDSRRANRQGVGGFFLTTLIRRLSVELPTMVLRILNAYRND